MQTNTPGGCGSDANKSSEFVLPSTEELVALYADDILRVCNYYLGKRSLAEDAFQDVFVRIIRKRDTFDGKCPPKYWVLTIARNICKDYLKSSWATKTGSFESIVEASGEKDEKSIQRRPRITSEATGKAQEDEFFDNLEETGELWDALNALSPAYKEVVLYRYYFDMDNATIAKRCGITESSVRSRLFRVRKILSEYDPNTKGTNI